MWEIHSPVHKAWTQRSMKYNESETLMEVLQDQVPVVTTSIILCSAKSLSWFLTGWVL